jgi:hypothetical protein
MNEKELTDILVRIQSIIRDTDECEKTQIRHIDTLVDWALAQEENDFPVPEAELTEFLDKYGEKEFYSVCTGRLSGEFCYAEYDYSDEEAIIFKLIWGINDGNEKTTNEEFYWISIDDFKNSKTFEEKYDKVTN